MASNGKITHIKDLHPDPENARKHTPRNVGMIEKALGEVGAARSIVIDEDGKILAGNATIEAAAQIGIENVQVIDADGETIVAVRRSGLTAEQKKRLALFDNRAAELAEWDVDQLQLDMDFLDGMFTDGELDKLGVELDEPPEDPGPQIDRAEELREKWQTETGQLWQLGAHRVIVGDCTDAAVVERVMGGERAQVFATDPPYGANAGTIGFTAIRDDIEAITKDDLQGLEMQSFLEAAFIACIPYLELDCAWYLWHPMLTQGYFTAAAAAADLIIHRQIIWNKEQFIYGRGDYHWRHELCFYGWRRGNRPPFYGQRNQDTIWHVDYEERRSEIGHPTGKPPRLFEIPLENHTKRNEISLDPFLGSGTTLIACERLGRRCRGVEISPAYVAVTLERWHEMTGEMPVLLA